MATLNAPRLFFGRFEKFADAQRWTEQSRAAFRACIGSTSAIPACFFLISGPKPQARSPHVFDQPYRFHDPIKADRGRSRASPDVGSEVFIGRCVDAEPGANQITDGFSLNSRTA